MENNEKYTKSPMLQPDAPDKASLKRRQEEETLEALGFKWVTDIQAWGSETTSKYSLPILRNFEARALADSIHDNITK